MNEIEKYLRQLETRNGYCSCTDLTGLYEKRKRAEALEIACDGFRAEADLDNPRRDDKPFLEAYKRRAEELRAASGVYHLALTDLAEKGKVKFVMHDPAKRTPIGKISFDNASSLLGADSEVIITVHCASCNQQIDVAG